MSEVEVLSQVINPAAARARATAPGRDGRAYALVADASKVDTSTPDVVDAEIVDESAGRRSRFYHQETSEEAEARRALQNARRNAAYARRRPARYADVSYELLSVHQSHDGKIARWWDSGPRAIVLAGPARTGKTTAAYAIGNDMQQRNVWTMSWTAADLSAALKPDSDQPFAFDYATTCDLLIIDDLGRERVTDWWLEQLQRVVDTRCSNGRRLVVTTNHGTSIGDVYDVLSGRYGYPLVERLIDDGAILYFNGPAVRRTVNEW